MRVLPLLLLAVATLAYAETDLLALLKKLESVERSLKETLEKRERVEVKKKDTPGTLLVEAAVTTGRNITDENQTIFFTDVSTNVDSAYNVTSGVYTCTRNRTLVINAVAETHENDEYSYFNYLSVIVTSGGTGQRREKRPSRTSNVTFTVCCHTDDTIEFVSKAPFIMDGGELEIYERTPKNPRNKTKRGNDFHPVFAAYPDDSTTEYGWDGERIVFLYTNDTEEEAYDFETGVYTCDEGLHIFQIKASSSHSEFNYADVYLSDGYRRKRLAPVHNDDIFRVNCTSEDDIEVFSKAPFTLYSGHFIVYEPEYE